jgi:hypothetical protein
MAFEMTGDRELIADLVIASEEMLPAIERVAGRAGQQMQKTARAILAGHRHLPHLGRAITYTAETVGDTVSVECGPERGRLQAGLGPYVEDGTIHNAPLPFMSPALDMEAGPFERYLGDLAVDLLEGAKLRV